jgi:gamma-tubulin complex component 2
MPLHIYIALLPRSTLETLSGITVDIVHRELRGGALLSLLHDKAVGQLDGAHAVDIAHHLAEAAAAPYFTMLERWIYKGVVDDPFGEFMVREDTTIQRDLASKLYNDAYVRNACMHA